MTDTSSVGTIFGTAKPQSNKDNNQATRQSTISVQGVLRSALNSLFKLSLAREQTKGDHRKSPEQENASARCLSGGFKPIKAGTQKKAQIQSNSTAQEPDRGDAHIIPHDYDPTAIIGAVALLLANISEQETLVDDMFQFISGCYQLARWPEEVNIAAGVLILRWISTGNRLHESNWRHLLLIALMVAQKVMDDIPLRNGQFCVIWESVTNDSSQLTLAEVNNLEAVFLKDIEYQVFVLSGKLISVYHELSDLTGQKERDDVINETSLLACPHGKKERRK